MRIMGQIPTVCPKCGTIFIGNKCPKCGYEILPTTPQTPKKTKFTGLE